MSALAHLTTRGLQAEVQGDKLIVRPKDRLNDDLRVWIREHKPEIVRELQPTSRTLYRVQVDHLAFTYVDNSGATLAQIKRRMRAQFGVDRVGEVTERGTP